jgi:glycosidase
VAPTAPVESPSSDGSSTVGPPDCPPAVAAAPTAIPATEHGWWRDRVFYEVFVRSFADSDGDGIGDLEGLIGRLDYLNDGNAGTREDLGITGIWLMPVAEAASYHGYDIVDYRAVERDYGTADDMRTLIAAAHERGIAVIVDMVPNHTSSEHPWFKDSMTPGSAHADWYVWADENPGYGGPDGQLVWHPAGDRYYYGLFWEGMPDLNLRNEAVTTELQDVARYWLRDIGVDGFRLDAVIHLVEDGREQVNTANTHAWLRDYHAAVHATNPAAMLVGEAWDVPRTTASYAPEDVDLVFDFGLAAATIDAVRRESARPLLAARLEEAGLYGPGEVATFLTNHDQARTATQLGGDADALRLAAGLLLTGRGTPFIYYGEELGMTGPKPDERIRTPMAWTPDGPAAGFSTASPWEPLEPGWETRNVGRESSDAGSVLAAYRDLVRLRGEHPALWDGEAIAVDSGVDPVAATLRVSSGERLLVLANLADEPVSAYSLSLDEGPLCREPRASIIFGAEEAAAQPLEMPIVTAAGGLDGYVPLPSLPPRSLTVIIFQP